MQVLLTLLRSGADPSVTNSSGKTSLGLAADHAEMGDFMDIAANLVTAGVTGTPGDWEVLARHPRKKLFVMMEILRTVQHRLSLRYKPGQTRQTCRMYDTDYFYCLCPGSYPGPR